MEQSSSEVNSSSDRGRGRRKKKKNFILCTAEVHNHIHHSLPSAPNLNQITEFNVCNMLLKKTAAYPYKKKNLHLHSKIDQLIIFM